jgi:hypothetical protein
MLKITKQTLRRTCLKNTLSSSDLFRANSKLNRVFKEGQPRIKIRSFLKLVAVLFPLSIYLIACGSYSNPATSVNGTSTTGPGQASNSGPGQTPTTGPGQTPTTDSGQTPTTGPGQTPTTDSGQTPTTDSGQTPTTGPNVTPTPTFSPDDPGVQAIPQPVEPYGCTANSDYWVCAINLQDNGTNQPTLPWTFTTNNLPGVTFNPASGTFPQDSQTNVNIPFSDCFSVQDSFVFAFSTANGRLKTTTSWKCPSGSTPTPT